MRISSLRFSIPCTMAAFATIALALFSSCDDKNKSTSGSAAAVSARLCSDGGARYDEKKRECICEAGHKWTGSVCEAISVHLSDIAPQPVKPPVPSLASSQPELPVVPAAAANPTHGAGQAAPTPPKADADSPAVTAPDLPKTEATQQPSHHEPLTALPSEPAPPDTLATESPTAPAAKAPRDSQLARELGRRCKAAKGIFQAADMYCHCGSGRLLSGSVCRNALDKNSAREICRTAIYPGMWRGDRCSCERSDTHFHPGRGGCTPSVVISSLTRRRICESAQDRGNWQAKSAQCLCPQGSIWHKGQCIRQGELSSEAVCRNPINGGRWDDKQRICLCPKNRLWIDQACRYGVSVSEEKACTGEFNRGAWHKQTAHCECGPGRMWRASERKCVSL